MRKTWLLALLPVLFFSCKKTQNSAPWSLPNGYSNQALGASANDLLSSAKYTKLNIQVQYMPGYAPDSAALANLIIYLEGICNKSDISISQSQISSTGADSMNLTNVAETEAKNRTTYTSGNTLGLYILITDGYDTAGAVLGFAYRNTSMCLFGKNIFDHSGGAGQITRTSLEASVLEHEFGHIMGLVNLGTPMVTSHQDVPHGNHCTNPSCLMYYLMELHTGYTAYSDIPTLDSNCLKDLAANGGK